MEALILAAGFGDRIKKGFESYQGPHTDKLRQLVFDENLSLIRHKGLIQINGQELVSYQLEQLKQAGIGLDNVYVHTNAVYYEQYCAWAEKVGIPQANIFNNGVEKYEDRNEQMGDLLLATKNIGTSQPLLVLACDTLVYGSGNELYDLTNMVDGFRSDGKSRLLVYRKDHDLSRHGIIEDDEEGNVVDFEEKPENPKSNLVNVSIYLFSSEYLDDMLAREALFRQYKNPLQLSRINFKREVASSRLDIGNIEDVLRANSVVS